MRDDSIAGLDGTLISPRAAREWLQAHHGGGAAQAAAIARWATAAQKALGPSMNDRRALHTLEALFEADMGYQCRREMSHSVAIAPSLDAIALFGFAWQQPVALASRAVLRAALDCGAEWAAGFNGIALGIVDARAASPRRIAALSLAHLSAHAATAAFAAALLEARAFASGAMPDVVRASDDSAGELKHGLRDGVHDSLGALREALPFDPAIGVLFRLLFVLFAEARSLVPVWHRIYRDHYSLESLAARHAPRDARGMWAALEGGRRLLGAGCRAGTLTVTGFNGRLFEPAPIRKWAASAALDSRLDRPAAAALASLVEYRPAKGGARRVDYAELDVEELGSIYERVLDLDPAAEGRARKESGSFYTPRPLTEFLVRRTLAPLVRDASARRILSLRIVDPAMGSGAFLIAALHYLASALERAMLEEGALPAGDVTDVDRRHLRRLVAQHCLYGVDVSPTATLLAKLSLWLATLSGDKPLGFLDHRLKCGNSLAGIEPLAARHPPASTQRYASLPLFDDAAYATLVASGAAGVSALSAMPEDTPADVRRKQQVFEAIDGGTLGSWKTVCDTWCAWWFMTAAARPDAREYAALADALVRDARLLPRRRLQRRLSEVASIAGAHRFFHWPLEFPEAFSGREFAGFDAVIGNPPWEMLRAGAGSGGREPLKHFVRASGIYPLSTGGHLNLYQLFVERALQLTRHGGRIGMVLPWGLMTDEGSAQLRARVLDGTNIDTLVRFDNAGALFQAHRSLRFAALTTTCGVATSAFELTRADGARGLDDLPDAGAPRKGAVITREALHCVGGRSRRVPDVADERTLALALKLARTNRAAADPEGWGARFGRELNLTDDRAAFGRSGMPVLEGKHVHPFAIDLTAGCHRISRARASHLLPDRPFDRPRLAYRDVTAATNRQTVIAAIVPAGMVTSHSLFCLRNDWDARTQHALCIILNSRVANFLIRLFVMSHLTTSLMEWLPLPNRARSVELLGGLDGFWSDSREQVPEAEREQRCRRKLAGGWRVAEALVEELYGLTDDEQAAI